MVRRHGGGTKDRNGFRRLNESVLRETHPLPMGHVIDNLGRSPKDLSNSAMERPRNCKELRRFMGMANQLGKFTPNIAEISQPLRELLSTKNAWAWAQARTQPSHNLRRS